MPLYQIHHSTPLTLTQKDALATHLTTLHSTRFTTLRNTVAVTFHPCAEDTYIGGARKPHNYVLAFVRSGANRTQDSWDAHCADIEARWRAVVVEDTAPRAKGASGTGAGEMGLRAVYLVGGMVAGMEAGVALPGAGEDEGWLERKWPELVGRAERGEGEWVENVREARERGLVREDGKVSGSMFSGALACGVG